MKFAAFILPIAAAVVANAAAFEARDTLVAAGGLCSAVGTVASQGTTEPIQPISATCATGLSCSATQQVTSLAGLGDLLGTAESLLTIVTALPVISSLPGVSEVISLVTSVLSLGAGGTSGGGLLGGGSGGLLGGILGSGGLLGGLLGGGGGGLLGGLLDNFVTTDITAQTCA